MSCGNFLRLGIYPNPLRFWELKVKVTLSSCLFKPDQDVCGQKPLQLTEGKSSDALIVDSICVLCFTAHNGKKWTENKQEITKK